MDRKAFYDALRPALGALTRIDKKPISFTPSQVAGIDYLLNVWERYIHGGLFDELAYNLATGWHETGGEMQPITERGPRSYFDKYEPGTRIGKVLGNTHRGDGYRFKGEGLVQNTGRANARKATKRLNELFKLGVDLEAHPEQRGDPLVSALSLFIGNREGWWTGKDLLDFLDGVDEGDAEDLREFIKARAVVNGTDKAEKIGRLALAFEAALKAGGYGQILPPLPTPEKLGWLAALIKFIVAIFTRRKS